MICIARPIGNYLPGKHSAKSRLQELEYILANEPNIPKIWLLYKIMNNGYREKIIELLRNQVYYEIPFDQAQMNKEGKKKYLFNINLARNFLVHKGLEKYEQVCLFDQDTYLDKHEYEKIIKNIDGDFEYYGLIGVRVAKTQRIPGEAMIIFTRKSKDFFNEEFLYGNGPKQELLWKIGFVKGQCASGTIIGERTKCVGNCLVLDFYNDKFQTDARLRIANRNESVISFLKSIK